MESVYWSGGEARTSVWFGKMPLRWRRNYEHPHTFILFFPRINWLNFLLVKTRFSSTFYFLLLIVVSLLDLLFLFSPLLSPHVVPAPSLPLLCTHRCPAQGFTWKWLYSRAQCWGRQCSRLVAALESVPSFLSRAICEVWRADWE